MAARRLGHRRGSCPRTANLKPYALTAVARMINQANGKRRRAAWTAHQRRLKTGRASAYRVAG